METLARGTALGCAGLLAGGTQTDAPFVILRGLGECPYGFWYQATQGETPVLLTVLDPRFVEAVLPSLRASIQRCRAVVHRNLLDCHGLGELGSRTFVAEGWPAGYTAREFAAERATAGDPLDISAAYTVVAHVCNAVAALHEARLAHGYITVDTVHVSTRGRVLVGARGFGPLLGQALGLARFRAGGLLPGMAPEQLARRPRLDPRSDVFAIAALFIELWTGTAIREPGQSLASLSLAPPPALGAVLEAAIAANPGRRPKDAAALKTALSEALKAAGLRAETRPPPWTGPQGSEEPAGPGHYPRPPAAPSPRAAGSARAEPQPGAREPDDDPETMSDDSPDASILGLNVGAFEDAAGRLSTLDGEPLDTTTLGPARSGTYFGNFPDTESRADMPRVSDESGFFVVRKPQDQDQGQDHGPYPIATLREMIADGRLASVDTLRHAETHDKCLAVDVAALRSACLAVVEEPAGDLELAIPKSRRARAAPPGAAPEGAGRSGRSASTTWLLVGLALAGFATAGWWVWRNGGLR